MVIFGRYYHLDLKHFVFALNLTVTVCAAAVIGGDMFKAGLWPVLKEISVNLEFYSR